MTPKKLFVTIVGVAVVALVVGVALGSIAFPSTKTDTSTLFPKTLTTTVEVPNLSGYAYRNTTLTLTKTITVDGNNTILGGTCTAVSYLLPDIVQEVSTVVTKIYPDTTYTTNSSVDIPPKTQTLGSSTYSSTTTVHNTTIYGVTTTSRYNTLDLSSHWSVINCTFG